MNTKVMGALAIFGLMALSSAASADSWDNYGRPVVTLSNESGLTINRFYMSSTNDGSWESDLLGNGVLRSGYHTTIYADRGDYDVKLVDRDGDQCIVKGVTVSGDRTLTITSDMLMQCEGYR